MRARWVLETKIDKDGNDIEKRMRWVGKGFSQKPGADYDSTFAPVVSPESCRIVYALAVQEDWNIRKQCDVPVAFLNGKIEHEVYIEQMEGFESKEHPRWVHRLNKAIYGAKQAANAWNREIDSLLKDTGMRRTQSDPCVYVSRRDSYRVLILLLHVDDLRFFGNDEEHLVVVVGKLSERFGLKDLDDKHLFLGSNLRMNPGQITIDQDSRIERVISELGLGDCNPVKTPMVPEYLSSSNADKTKLGIEDHSRYREIIGFVSYVASTYRPDLSLAVNFLSRKQSEPNEYDWAAAKRILRYLKGTSSMKLIFEKKDQSSNELMAYVDSDFATCPKTRRSTTGYLVVMNGSPVAWKAFKQSLLATSTSEAEYIAISTVAKKVRWARTFLLELGFEQQKPTVVWEDNTGAIVTANSIITEASKHMELKQHYAREAVSDGVIDVRKIGTKDQVADALTKPLPKESFEKHRSLMKLQGGV